MRTLPLLLVFLSAACNSAPDRLIGKWEFDPESMNFSPSFRSLPQEHKEHLIAKARWNLEFTKDTLKWDHAMWGWGSEKWEAKYRIESHDGNRVTVDIGRSKMVFTVTDDRLRFGYKGRPILLRREK